MLATHHCCPCRFKGMPQRLLLKRFRAVSPQDIINRAQVKERSVSIFLYALDYTNQSLESGAASGSLPHKLDDKKINTFGGNNQESQLTATIVIMRIGQMSQ